MQPPLCDKILDNIKSHYVSYYSYYLFWDFSSWSLQVRFITGNKILRILKSKGMAPELPEDCYHLIKKAVSIRKHLERNRKDRDAKFRLILVESRIHRLARSIIRHKWNMASFMIPHLLYDYGMDIPEIYFWS